MPNIEVSKSKIIRLLIAAVLVSCLSSLPPCSAQSTVRPSIHKYAGGMIPQSCITEARKLQAKGKHEEIIKLMNLCLRDRPDVVALYFYRAEAYMKLKRFREALADCTAQIKLERQIYKPYEMRAQCYLALKDRKRAYRDFMQVVELKPSHAYAHEQLAKYYREEGDLKNWKREVSLAKSSKSARKADLVSSEVLTRHDHQVAELLRQANQNLARKKPGLTLEACKKLLALTDKDLAVENINKGEIYDLQAQAFQQMTLNDEAIIALNQVLKFQPWNTSAYYFRAQSYFEIGKYDECLADCDRAARGDKILSNTVAQLRAQTADRLKRRHEHR